MAILASYCVFHSWSVQKNRVLRRYSGVWQYLRGGVGLWSVSEADRKRCIIPLMQTDTVTGTF